MSADNQMSYGAYTYSSVAGLTIQRLTDPMAVRPRTAETPGKDGAYSAGGLLGSRRFSMRGLMQGTSADNLRTIWRAFRAAHKPGAARTFYRHSDEYINAEVVGISEAEFNEMGRVHIRFEVDFLAVDPFAYKSTTDSQTGLAAGGTATNNGTAYVMPSLALDISSIGTSGTVTITNTTTGQALTLTPAATGVNTIDCGAETVVRGGVDKTTELSTASEFMRLDPGANTITVSTTGGLTVSTLAFTWREAHY